MYWDLRREPKAMTRLRERKVGIGYFSGVNSAKEWIGNRAERVKPIPGMSVDIPKEGEKGGGGGGEVELCRLDESKEGRRETRGEAQCNQSGKLARTNSLSAGGEQLELSVNYRCEKHVPAANPANQISKGPGRVEPQPLPLSPTEDGDELPGNEVCLLLPGEL
ncbi:uncharacterized protein LY89DRAFT_232573 [Mollisia scopiformis]|uniref:Uncharacterized protein n=1 Tax=Mollisia scopiformis TaxID=149040 RepID=A0A194WVX8_MOLSC|nr:uncharacterized protein LY89DRAFT_232573 [Mollisia scopiformis]KUJ11747.1 hypothetical protein LY89DRAFT_232573 [Mollisia scopiformis]